MNTRHLHRWAVALCVLVCAAAGNSCTTYYDAYGYPQQSVDPGLAVAGVVAAGALGYALADSHDHRRSRYNSGHHRYDRGYKRSHRDYYYDRRRNSSYCY